jgi:hypothetical protein
MPLSGGLGPTASRFFEPIVQADFPVACDADSVRKRQTGLLRIDIQKVRDAALRRLGSMRKFGLRSPGFFKVLTELHARIIGCLFGNVNRRPICGDVAFPIAFGP